MNTEDKKNQNSGSDISPAFPLMLLGAILLGIILGLLKLIGIL